MAHGNVIGIDLGGTKVAMGRFDAHTFACEAQEKILTNAARGFDAVLEDIVAAIEKLRNEETTAIGIGVPGLIRQPSGIVINMPNIPGAKEYPLKNYLTKRLGLPVEVDNDANCFALTEARLGAGKGHKVVVGVTLGTGVGGGIVINGKIFHGGNGFAAEVGHMLLQPGKPPFESEDQRGRVEQFFSGTAMGKRCPEAEDPKDYLEGAVCEIMQPAIFREVAWFVTNITYLLDPNIIVFGGSAAPSMALHFGKIEEELKTWTLPGTPLPKLALAEIPDAGLLGAALVTQ